MNRTLQIAKDAKKLTDIKMFIFDKLNEFQELEKTEKFSEEEARNYIRRMLREASIYESKPGHYNRV